MTSSNRKSSIVNRKSLALLAVAFAIVVFWNWRILYPLKILAVFFHEVSHGVASALTGGKIIHINLNRHEGGAIFTSGGSTFLILNAGYLGSLLFGGLILVAASRTRRSREIMMALGAALMFIGLWYVRPFFSFGLLYSLVFGAVLASCAVKLPKEWNTTILQIIGLTSCLYAVGDVVSDTIVRQIPASDAQALARYTFVPGIIWGLLWLVISLAGTYFFLRLAMRENRGR